MSKAISKPSIDESIRYLMFYLGIRAIADKNGSTGFEVLEDRAAGHEKELAANLEYYNIGQDMARFWELLQSPIIKTDEEAAVYMAMFQRIGGVAADVFTVSERLTGTNKIVCGLLARDQPLPTP